MAKRQGKRVQPGKTGPGTLMRGADGTLYYVPDHELEQYVVDEPTARAVRRVLGPRPSVKTELIHGQALKRAGLIVASEISLISVVSIGAIRPRKS